MKQIFGIPINKFFALFFLTLAFGFLVFEFAFDIATFGISYVMTFSNIWNHLLLIACFVVLLIMNIRNDDRAYIGLSLFVFFVAFDGIFGVGDSFQYAIYWLNNGKSFVGLLYLLSIFFWLGQLGLGVVTYLFLARYRFGRTNNFKLVRLFSILFFVALVLTTISTFSLLFLSDSGYGIETYLSSGSYFLAEIAAGAACIFTLNRLRRL